jgi:hypothetical protein
MDRSGTGLLTDAEIALTAEDVALLERAEAIRRLIERERPTRDERLDLLAWVVWPSSSCAPARTVHSGPTRL